MATVCTFTITNFRMRLDFCHSVSLEEDLLGKGEIWREEDGSYDMVFTLAGAEWADPEADTSFGIEELPRFLSNETDEYGASCITQMDICGIRVHGADSIMSILRGLMHIKEEE